jgi:hypothetical protein
MEPGDRIISIIIGVSIVFLLFVGIILFSQFVFGGNGAPSRIAAVTAFKSGEEITLNYWGGQDADKLSQFIITVNGIEQPEKLGIIPGSSSIFPGTSKQDHVVVKGQFDSGKWTVLDRSVTETVQIKKQGDRITIIYVGSSEDNVIDRNYSVFLNEIDQNVIFGNSPGSNITLKGTFGEDHLVVQGILPFIVMNNTLESNTSVVVDTYI